MFEGVLKAMAVYVCHRESWMEREREEGESERVREEGERAREEGESRERVREEGESRERE